MLSVALCTYNGARFIEEQLWSILHQTLSVNEVIVCDDGSTDTTIQNVEKIKEKTSIDIRIYRNERNLGVSANFHKAVDLCCGDIIFLSDQDDIWHQDKVKTIIEWFDSHPDKSVVFTDANLIDEHGDCIYAESTPCRLWDYYFCDSDKKMFEKGLSIECMMRAHATGASMAVRKNFIEAHPFLHQTNHLVYHDLAICINAVELGVLGFIDDTLFSYRLHANQQIGVGGFTRNPEITDWRCAAYPEDFIRSLLKDKKSIARIDFLFWRIWTKHRIYGPLVILLTIRKYHKYYGHLSHSLMLYDIMTNVNYTKKRLIRKMKALFHKPDPFCL